MGGISEGMREVRVEMHAGNAGNQDEHDENVGNQGGNAEINRNRKKNKMKVYKIEVSFLAEIEKQNKIRIVIKC